MTTTNTPTNAADKKNTNLEADLNEMAAAAAELEGILEPGKSKTNSSETNSNPTKEVKMSASANSATKTNRTHASDLIPANTSYVVADHVPHVQSLTFHANMFKVNDRQEGDPAVVIEHSWLSMVALRLISDMRLGYGPKIVDQDGKFQINKTVEQLKGAGAMSIENVGVVRSDYDGRFAKAIVGFVPAKIEEPEEGEDAEVVTLMSMKESVQWLRLRWENGALHISKRLSEIAPRATEAKEVTMMRYQIARHNVYTMLLDAEKNGRSIWFKVSYRDGFEMAYYLDLFGRTIDEAKEIRQQHIDASIARKEDQRLYFRAQDAGGWDALAVQTRNRPVEVTTVAGGVKTTVKVETPSDEMELPVKTVEGELVDLTTIVGKSIVRYNGEVQVDRMPILLRKENLDEWYLRIVKSNYVIEIQ